MIFVGIDDLLTFIIAWFLFSALLYLNGDFKGGEFLFANPDDSIQVWFNVLSNY